MVIAARLKVLIPDIDPAPWRIVDVPLSITLKGLHETIHATFSWDERHPWQFEISGQRYGQCQSGVQLDSILSPYKKSLWFLMSCDVKEFSCVYDIRGGVEHRIKVAELFTAPSGVELPRYVDGGF